MGNSDKYTRVKYLSRVFGAAPNGGSRFAVFGSPTPHTCPFHNVARPSNEGLHLYLDLRPESWSL